MKFNDSMHHHFHLLATRQDSLIKKTTNQDSIKFYQGVADQFDHWGWDYANKGDALNDKINKILRQKYIDSCLTHN